MKKKILFIPEAVSWSHVVWLLVLARGSTRANMRFTLLPRSSTSVCCGHGLHTLAN